MAELDKDIVKTDPNVPLVVVFVQNRQKPYLDLFHSNYPVHKTIDSGGTTNLIRHSLSSSVLAVA